MITEIKQWLPLLVAFVAGIFALSQIRSNNITNARIKWLENFKQVITDFLSVCTVLQIKEGVIKGVNERSVMVATPDNVKSLVDRFNENVIEHLREIETRYTQIKLNLNPNEQLHQKLEDLLDDYMDLLNKIPIKKASDEYNALVRSMGACFDTMALLTRYIVKLEWEKTKRPYLLRKWYMKFGRGKFLLQKAISLELLPERPPLKK